MKTWHVDIITLHPEIFPGPLNVSVIGKALQKSIWSFNTINLHDYTPQNTRVDDRPYGGGPGMVIRPDIVANAIESIKTRTEKTPIIYMSARGKLLKQEYLNSFTKLNNIIIICGRFEGIDQRVIDLYSIHEVSIGDYILAGGDIAAMAFIESCVRLLPGVLGNTDSINDESFSDGNLEYSHYTRPYQWNNMQPPDVLISGNHQLIREWRIKNSLDTTLKYRPDLSKE